MKENLINIGVKAKKASKTKTYPIKINVHENKKIVSKFG